MPVEIGMRGEAETVVTAQDTAQAMGSGLAPVLATPRMVALMEGAAPPAVRIIVKNTGNGVRGMSHILVVDDDIHIGNLLQEALEAEGFRVSRAYSGTEAVLALDRERPDLILLDLMLPGHRGQF